MVNRLRALVVSPDTDALQRIKASFESTGGADVTLRTTYTAAPDDCHDVLVLHAPIDWLRKMRASGYQQPALILTDANDRMCATPLDADLCPVEDVTWDIVRAGFLPTCIEMLLGVLSA